MLQSGPPSLLREEGHEVRWRLGLAMWGWVRGICRALEGVCRIGAGSTQAAPLSTIDILLFAVRSDMG